MTPKDIFAIAVRIVGVIGLLYLLSTSVMFFGGGLPWPFVLKSGVLALLSLWFIRGAPLLVRFAYPERQ